MFSDIKKCHCTKVLYLYLLIISPSYGCKMKWFSFKMTLGKISYNQSGHHLHSSVAPQVMPVSYVRFGTSPVLSTHSRESLRALPLGIVLTFSVHFHASTGEVLHSSNSLLSFSTNRSVGKHTLATALLMKIKHLWRKSSTFWSKCHRNNK